MDEEKEPSRCCWRNGNLGCPYVETAKLYVLGDPKFVLMKLYVLDDLAQTFQTTEATKEVDQVTLSPEGNEPTQCH